MAAVACECEIRSGIWVRRLLEGGGWMAEKTGRIWRPIESAKKKWQGPSNVYAWCDLNGSIIEQFIREETRKLEWWPEQSVDTVEYVANSRADIDDGGLCRPGRIRSTDFDGKEASGGRQAGVRRLKCKGNNAEPWVQHRALGAKNQQALIEDLNIGNGWTEEREGNEVQNS